MATDNFLDTRQFTFKLFPHPLHPDDIGDSGALQLATSKTDPLTQYIVKNGFPELGCNEFMYHKVASALGLYTQNAKRFKNKQYKNAAAVRYVPNARLYRHSEASLENRKAFYSFEALFCILNETDSHEYYLDGDDRLFKLDNAASFKLDLSPAAQALSMMSGGADIFSGARETESEKYELTRICLIRECGQEADEPYTETFQRFAELDMEVFDEAADALEKNYPSYIVGYLYNFIKYRIKSCRQYIDERKNI